LIETPFLPKHVKHLLKPLEDNDAIEILTRGSAAGHIRMGLGYSFL